MKSLDNLLEKRKIFFIIPLAIVLIAAIMMIIFNFTLGSPLNLGTDFTGGYSIDVQLRSKLNDDNYEEYCDQIRDLMSSVTTEEGKEYSIRIDNMQRQGTGDKSSIHIKYFAVNGVSDSEMLDQINPAIRKKLGSIMTIIPTVSIADNKINIEYGEVLVEKSFETRKTDFIALVDKLNELGASITFNGEAADNIVLDPDNKKHIIVTCATVTDSEAVRNEITTAMRIPDPSSGQVTTGELVSATVSTELLFNAVLAVSLALVFMLCYIGIRFQLSSGLACILALFHDILIMFSFMAICRIEINSTFVAALITILGYSINNSIIIFDRVRENNRSIFSAEMTPEQIANKSIKETLLRSINTTITTLIMILMVAIIGVEDIRVFAFPIIIGLLAGTFSSICIAPSLWAMFQHVGKKKPNKYNTKSNNDIKDNSIEVHA